MFLKGGGKGMMNNGTKLAFLCVGLSFISYILLYGKFSPEEQGIYNDIIDKFKHNELSSLNNQQLDVLNKKKIDLKSALYQADSAAAIIFSTALPFVPVFIPFIYLIKKFDATSLVTVPYFFMLYTFINDRIRQNKLYKQKLQDEFDFIDQVIRKMQRE